MYVEHPLIKPGKIEARLYQEAIFAKSSNQNTLVVLPTGLGKTAIALLLAAKRLSSGRIIMLAPTKPLVVQHAKTFSESMEVNAAEITGTIPIGKRMELWKEKVVCATPQTLRNDLMRGVGLEDVSLIIFDEAHRAVGDYAYGFVAKEYMEKSKTPLILGLTASPGSDREAISEVCKNLFIEHIEFRQHNDADVVSYVKPVDIEYRKVELPAEMNEIRELIKENARVVLHELKEDKFISSADLRFVKRNDLLKIQSLAQQHRDYKAIANSAAAIKIMYALELLETQGVGALSLYLEKLKGDTSKSAKKLVDSYIFVRVLEKLKELIAKKVEHPKQAILMEVVQKKCIVFSHYKSQANHIVGLLREKGYKAELLVGRSGMSQKTQKEIVEKFRNEETDILVATSIGEEGLDIPIVDLVIFYEPIPSAIRSIQRKGRTARHRPGKVVILVTKGTRDEAYLYVSEHKQEKMREIIKQVNLAKVGERQKTLRSFNPGDRVVVLVDTREAGSQVVSALKELVEVQLAQLPVADYLCSDRVGIERKSAQDFVGSIIDKRLFEQVIQLKENYRKPVLIIEGTDLYTHRAIHPNAVRGALAALAIDLSIPIIFSQNPHDTAGIIATIAKREQEDKNKAPNLLDKKKAETIPEQQVRLVAGLPHIGELTAENLLKHFGTPEKVFTASESELSEVENIGKVKAQNMRKLLTDEWKKSDQPQESSNQNSEKVG